MSLPEPGVEIDGYTITASLGAGAMGRVYRAREAGTGREVALKLLHAGRQASPAVLERSRRERMALASVSHPHVLRVHSAGSYRGNPYLVTEIAPGGSLDDWLVAGSSPASPPDLTEGIRLVREVALGLAALHAAGIVHRDLKPGNVLLDEQGRAKVADLGLVVIDEAETLTKTGAMVGSPAYMSPEALTGKRLRDPRVDVYSLGVLAYEVLTGELPHNAPSALLLAIERAGQPARDPRELRAEIPARVAEAIVAAMQGDPDQRPADGAAFVRLLDAEAKAPRSGTGLALGGLAALALSGALLFAWVGANSGIEARPAQAPSSPTTTRPSPPRPTVTKPLAPRLERVWEASLPGWTAYLGSVGDAQVLAACQDQPAKRVRLVEIGAEGAVSTLGQIELSAKLSARAFGLGGLCVASEEGELAFFTRGTHAERAQLPPSLSATCLTLHEGSFWVGTQTGGVYRWRPGQGRLELATSVGRPVMHLASGERALELFVAAGSVPQTFARIRLVGREPTLCDASWAGGPTSILRGDRDTYLVGTAAHELVAWEPHVIRPFQPPPSEEIASREDQKLLNDRFPSHHEVVWALGRCGPIVASGNSRVVRPLPRPAELRLWEIDSRRFLLVQPTGQSHLRAFTTREVAPRTYELTALGDRPLAVRYRLRY